METFDNLRENLENKQKFIPVLNYFIKKSISECNEKDSDHLNPLSYSVFYETFIIETIECYVDIVFKHCESPIERIFVNSLILLFLKNGYLGVQLHPPTNNVIQEIKNFKSIHLNILDSEKMYKEDTGDYNLENLEKDFDKYFEYQGSTKEAYETFSMHTSLIKHFIWKTYHLTLQAGFPNFNNSNKAARVDFLLWCPGDDNVKIIIECDGFKYHSNKSSFEADRKRDRVFQAMGYNVLRYSGGEIYNDPVAVASNIFDTIQAIDKNEDRML